MVGPLHTEYADNDAVLAFHQYFRNTWLDGMFPVALWNHHGVDSQMPRTTMLNLGMHALIALYAARIRTCIIIIFVYFRLTHATKQRKKGKGRKQMSFKNTNVILKYCNMTLTLNQQISKSVRMLVQ